MKRIKYNSSIKRLPRDIFEIKEQTAFVSAQYLSYYNKLRRSKPALKYKKTWGIYQERYYVLSLIKSKIPDWVWRNGFVAYKRKPLIKKLILLIFFLFIGCNNISNPINPKDNVPHIPRAMKFNDISCDSISFDFQTNEFHLYFDGCGLTIPNFREYCKSHDFNIK